MAISGNNPRLNLLRRLSADSGTEIIYRYSSDFPQLPDYVLFAQSRGWRMFPTPGRLWIESIEIADATSDLTRLGQWADELSGFNWSVATGPESGVFAIESAEPYGLSNLRELSQLDWPETLYSSSRNYLVAFFNYPSGKRAIGSGRIEIAPGLTVIADGGSVVIPPPHDPERWPGSDAPVLESPEWLNECAFESVEPDDPPVQEDPSIQETRRFTLIRGGRYWGGRVPQQ
jgi:hypothetical protein